MTGGSAIRIDYKPNGVSGYACQLIGALGPLVIVTLVMGPPRSRWLQTGFLCRRPWPQWASTRATSTRDGEPGTKKSGGIM